MQNKLIRETKIDKFTQLLIDSGKFVISIQTPLLACKKALEQIELCNENRFIEMVLNDINSADVKSLDAVKSLKRLHRSLQAIHKVITQEKIGRFNTLTVNGMLNQKSISDDDFELFINIIDELTDTEFFLLSKIYNIEKEHEGEKFNPKQDKIKENLLSESNMNLGMFTSYVNRLKSKGLIMEAHGVFLSYDTPFYISIVDGVTSELAKNLLKFIGNNVK